jgi:glycosyltransferase involved in cell wall biosynthesis
VRPVKRRLALITEIIAPYRIPVFNELAASFNLDLHVIFLAETDPALRQWLIYKDELRFSYEVLPSKRLRLGSSKILLNSGMAGALSHFSPDAIICGGYSDPACWSARRWAKRNDVPLLAWVESNANDHRSHNALKESLKKIFLGSCQAVIVSGESSKQYVQSFGVSEKMIVVAPNAVDNDLFSKGATLAQEQSAQLRSQLQLPQRYFLYVGRFLREKGLFDLLEAYRLIDDDVRSGMGLVLVGDGPDRQELEKLSHEISPGKVLFPGFVQRDQLPSYYALADAFVFPTHSDPWGLAVNEAMACGLPVIVGRAAGCVADLARDEWNGYVVDPADHRQLATSIQKLTSDAVLRALMGERSLARISHFSPLHCAEGMFRAADAAWKTNV